MAVSENLYFWKRRNIGGAPAGRGGRFVTWIVTLLVLFAGGGGAGYYYFVWKPEQERLARVQAEQTARQQKIKAIEDFYRNSLSGGSISDANNLLEQILISSEKLSQAGFSVNSIVCNSVDCSFSYMLNPGRIFSVLDINVWGETYSPSFSKTMLDYTGVKSRLNQHPWFTAWQEKQSVNLPVCTDILSYISTWNSLASKENAELELNEMPGSTVESNENALKGAVTSFGMLFAGWSITLPTKMDIVGVALVLNKQPFADAFIIKSIEFNETSTLVTGGLACKKGN
ncbi:MULTISPECIES: hypothetical protein [Citrobacter]|uniref:hypothetical protein n=1 Tax=Citrobacter TaxID=544 RepID=UPI0018EC42F5|nr:hypothetical protein [Citrobacter braakii]WAD29067.1 hypothetical protein MKJ05_12360 [Citrobacter braakii]